MYDIPALTERSRAYISAIEKAVHSTSAAELVSRVERLVAGQDNWRAHCLNLNPAETLMSRRSRALLNSDMATRLTEGVPGDKLYPHGAQNDVIDEIEATIIALAREQFGAKYIEWRPVSTTMANAAVFFAAMRSGDVMLSQDEDGGGNYAYHRFGPAGLFDARIEPIPRHGDCFEIDLDGLRRAAQRTRPKVIALGGSNVLFPYPLGEIRAIADEVDAIVLYDAAHVGLLVSSGTFQRPLEEGAHALTVSTAKSLGGPIGGLVLTNDSALAEKIIKLTFPGLLQTRDLNKLCAFALTLLETRAFGAERAAQSVSNARALAGALQDEGFSLLASDRGYTDTHQIFLTLGNQAKTFEQRCNSSNIMLTDCALSGDMALGRRSGSRLGTHEVTRLGLVEDDMKTIARLIRRAHGGEASELIKAEVSALVTRNPTLAFSFDHDKA